MKGKTEKVGASGYGGITVLAASNINDQAILEKTSPCAPSGAVEPSLGF
jgi:hypothetical protein